MTKVYSILFFYLMLNASYADIVGKTYIDYGDARTMGRVGTYNAENNQWDTTGKESTITTAINAIKNKIGSGLDETNTIGDTLKNKFGITADSNSAIITDNNGKMIGGQINSAKIEDKVVTSSNIATQSITNADIANNAAIDMDKLKLPNKDHCAGKLCILIYKGGVNQFVWEPIADVFRVDYTIMPYKIEFISHTAPNKGIYKAYFSWGTITFETLVLEAEDCRWFGIGGKGGGENIVAAKNCVYDNDRDADCRLCDPTKILPASYFNDPKYTADEIYNNYANPLIKYSRIIGINDETISDAHWVTSGIYDDSVCYEPWGGCGSKYLLEDQWYITPVVKIIPELLYGARIPDSSQCNGDVQCAHQNKHVEYQTKVDYTQEGIDLNSLSNSGDDCRNGDCTGFMPGEWEINFDYGDVRGIASCNDISGTNNDYLYTNPSTSSAYSMYRTSVGANCWCKITTFAGKTLANAPWVFYNKIGSSSNDMCHRGIPYSCSQICANVCSALCAEDIMWNENLRSALYKNSGIADNQ